MRRFTEGRSRAWLRSLGRGLAAFLLLAMVLGLAGTILGMLSWLGPVPSPHFVGVWITDYATRALPTSASFDRDRNGLQQGDYFRNTEAIRNPDATTLLSELSRWRKLPARDALIVHISAHAMRDAQGKIHILPADASIDNPLTWVPIKHVLQALRSNPAKHKLLILDIMKRLADPRLGVLSDVVTASLPQLLNEVPDPGRLVLCACSPGQEALTSADMGRSVFGYYLEEGLRGYADGHGIAGKRDGFVTVRELAAFLQARVDRWAHRNRGQRQTPVLLGAADDFTLVALPHRRTREHLGPVECPPYPDWLQAAWRDRDALQDSGAYRLSPRPFQQMQATLLDAENSWREGLTDDQRGKTFQAKLAKLRADIAGNKKQAEYHHMSLALPMETDPCDDVRTRNVNACLAAVQDVMTRFKQQSAGLSKKDRSDLAARLIDGFRLRIKDAPPADAARAIWAAAVADRQADAETLDLLDQLSRSVSPAPQHVETLLLRQLADLGRRGDVEPWPRVAVQRALQAAHAGAKLMRPELFPWIRGPLAHAAQARHDGEIHLWARGFADPESADHLLKQAVELYRDIEDAAEPIQWALEIRTSAMAMLPFYLRHVEANPAMLKHWEDAVRAMIELDELLRPNLSAAEAASAPRARTAATPCDDTGAAIRQILDRLSKALTPIERPCTTHLPDLESMARSPRADGDIHRQIESLLSMPLLKAEDRARLSNAARDLAKRLHRETVELDRVEETADAIYVRSPRWEPPDLETVRVTGERRARISFALAELGGLNPDRLASLRTSLQEAKTGAQWCGLGDELRTLWAEQLPCAYRETSTPAERVRLCWVAPPRDHIPAIDNAPTSPAVTLARKQAEAWWEWQSQHYHYQGRDYQGAGLEGETTTVARQFYQQAAFANTQLHQPGAGESLVIRAKKMPNALSISSPETRAVLEIKATAQPRARGPIRFGAIRPAANWLDISPEAISFASFAPKAGRTVPLRVRLRPPEERGQGNRPSGFLVQASYAERNYHLVVPIALEAGPHDLQVLLGSDARQPDSDLRQIRLRPGNVPQPYYLFAKNPTSRPRAVHVQIRTADRMVAETAEAVHLNAEETRPVPLTATSDGAYTEIKGPLHLLMLDAENKNAVLDSRHISLAIASPAEYVRVEEATLTSAGGNQYGFSARLQAISPPAGPPIPADLILSPHLISGLRSPGTGTFRGELSSAKKTGSLTLFAEKLELAAGSSGTGPIHIDVDGMSRAFSFILNWGPAGAFLVPQENSKPEVRLSVPTFTAPQKSFRFPIEVDRAPPGSMLEVRLGRIGHAGFEAEVTRAFPADKKRRIDMQLQGPSHAIVLRASEQDWIADLDLSKIAGQRLLQARLLDDQGSDLQQAMQSLTIDDSAPGGIRFLGMPAKAKRGTTLHLKATAKAESGIASVKWFVGRPAQGKVPMGTKVIAARPPATDSNVWTGSLLLPDRVGPVEISALISNRVGKAVFATTVIELTDIEPALIGNGKIEGRVLEGGRPQPDLDVILEDEAGHEKAQTRTTRDGAFRFDDIPPGRYVLRSFKPASGRRGAIPATVTPNQTESVTIALTL